MAEAGPRQPMTGTMVIAFLPMILGALIDDFKTAVTPKDNIGPQRAILTTSFGQWLYVKSRNGCAKHRPSLSILSVPRRALESAGFSVDLSCQRTVRFHQW